MEPGRFPTQMPSAVATRPHPDSRRDDDVVTIDLSVEASAALAPESPSPASGDLPEALRGMYFTG